MGLVKTEIYPVVGMHCASCATTVKRNILKTGASDCSVNMVTEKATITYDTEVTNINKFNNAISKYGYSLLDPQVESTETQYNNENDQNHSVNLDSSKTEVFFIFPLSLLVFAVMMWDIAVSQFSFLPPLFVPMKSLNLFLFLLSAYSIFGIGKTFTYAVWRFLLYRKANMDTLIGIGTLTAFTFSSFIYFFPQKSSSMGFPETLYFDAVVVVIGFVKFGKFLEAWSKKKTGEALEKLMHLQAKTALVERDGKEVEISISKLKEGDIFIVKPGASVPTDGIVIRGSSSVDESVVTGESLPVDKNINDKVTGATLNQDGVLYCRAIKIGRETVLSQIIEMVEKAQNTKAPVEQMADKISGVFVPTVLVFAILVFLVWILYGSNFMSLADSFVYGLTAFVGIVVIACPCALGLATPTAMVVAMGKGAGLGILIKNAQSLEKLEKVNTILLDKTGTLTEGKLVVTDIISTSNTTKNELLKICASLEKESEHPLARAILLKADELKIKLMKTTGFKNLKGKGLKGILAGKEYTVGNFTIIQELGIKFDEKYLSLFTKQGKTPVFVVQGNKLLGVLYLADTLKSNATSSIQELNKLGINPVMLTGDDENTAKYISGIAGIKNVYGRVLPNGKAEYVKKFQQQKQVVAMIGDGVNDAPALATADVGIAMSTGTDVAMSTANITLLQGDISKVTKSIILSKKTMSIVRQNLFWAFIYNIIGIPLAAGVLFPFTGALLNPVFAGMAMALSSVSVVANSLRLKTIEI